MWLNPGSEFPDVETATPEGLVAVGGDLLPERLLGAYRKGIYPWYGPGQPILWWSPDPRAIIPLDRIHIGRSLKKTLRANPFEIRINTAFREVVTACGDRPGGLDETWITPEMVEAYVRLYEMGHAHSVEAWEGDELVGGLYGVTVGGLFAGESMFHRRTNASKVALIALTDRLKERGFTLLDCQMLTPITESIGARSIARNDYMDRLAAALERDCRFV